MYPGKYPWSSKLLFEQELYESLGCEIFKMSVNVELKTSSALTPYYSLELTLLSSTSHLLTPRSAHN